jgi:hypothetical protein
MATELRTDGPHSPEYTREVGNVLAEAVRVLNYASLCDAPGFEYPGDVYTLLGAWYTATQRMPQLAGQLKDYLDGWQASAQLADANGADVNERVAAAAYQLGLAHGAANDLTKALQQAQNAISGLYVKEAPDA